MEAFFITALAAFIGTFAANTTGQMLMTKRTEAAARAQKMSSSYVITAAIIFAATSTLVFYFVSEGLMAPGLASFAILLMLGTLRFASRAFRLPSDR